MAALLSLLAFARTAAAAGYRSGVHVGQARMRAAFAAGPVRVLVGTQTGTAMSFAESLRDAADGGGSPLAMEVRDLGEYDAAAAFERERQVVLLLACYGVGEPTDNARSFVKWLMDPARTPLPDLKYAVFGLGSSKTHKSNYNVVAKMVDARLQALGATRSFPLGLGDDSGWFVRTAMPVNARTRARILTLYACAGRVRTPRSIEVDFQTWQDSLLDGVRTSPAPAAATPAVTTSAPAPAPAPAAAATSAPAPAPALAQRSAPIDGGGSGPYSFELRRPTACAVSYEARAVAALLRTPLEGSASPFYRPGTAPLPVRFHRSLNPAYPDSMLELGLGLPPSIQYATGDHVGVYPENDPGLVDRIAQRCRVDPELELVGVPASELATAAASPVRRRALPFPSDGGLRVRDVLTRCLELQSLPQPAALAVLATCASDAAERARLNALASTGALYKDAVWRPNLHLADVLDSFPSITLTLASLIQATPLLRPRFYSIASSALQFPDELRIVYRWVHYRHAATGLDRQGVCTRYLNTLSPRRATGTTPAGLGHGAESAVASADTAADASPLVYAFVRPSSFRQPADPATPVVFIAGGSGIAPVRAFLEERLYLATTRGVKFGPGLLAFGVREPDDLACGDLIRACLSAGALTDAAISYSMPAPPGAAAPYLARYVAQDIDDHGDQIWRALAPDGGGNLYLCGGASAFASSCHQALRRVFHKHGGMADPEAQEQFFLSLLQTKRYQEDLAD